MGSKGEGVVGDVLSSCHESSGACSRFHHGHRILFMLHKLPRAMTAFVVPSFSGDRLKDADVNNFLGSTATVRLKSLLLSCRLRSMNGYAYDLNQWL